ncbi:uncharacterized protein LY79DRAFT_116649 [Colletotrichum navitas]|uniref:Transmembrane protein n=1 Tax=Colletotrichum navitas TaxID=681940 RepID=A0AAD8Q4F9_9PEZI|nr:uncharacterized protein LY79DRAFT_116649 [Colletotrichum navitas]KAK1595031.1 hypothetical protein LY79DRAFT_116649 [Colletotrichum navitas]
MTLDLSMTRSGADLRQKSQTFYLFFFSLARSSVPFVSSCRFDAETRALFNPKTSKPTQDTAPRGPRRLFLSASRSNAIHVTSGSSCGGPLGGKVFFFFFFLFFFLPLLLFSPLPLPPSPFSAPSQSSADTHGSRGIDAAQALLGSHLPQL